MKSNSRTSGENSEIKQLQIKYDQLKQTNTRLNNELSSIREQFHEATSINEQLEQMHQQNIRLMNEIHSLSAEKDDLTKRLEISLQMNEEFRESSDKEKEIETNMLKSDFEQVKKTLELERQKFESDRNDFGHKLKSVNSLLENEQQSNYELNNTIKKLLEAAQKYFNNSYSNPKQLISFLSTNEIKVSEKEDTNKDQEIISKLIQKSKYYKHGLKDEMNQRRQLENKVQQLSNEINRQSKEHQFQLSESESKVKQLEYEIRACEDRYKQELTGKVKAIEELKTLVQTAKKSNHKTKVVKSNNDHEKTRLKEQLESQSDKIQDIVNQIDELSVKSSALESEIQKYKSLYKNTKQKLRESNDKIAENEKEVAKYQKELTNQRLEIENLQNQNIVLEQKAELTSSSMKDVSSDYKQVKKQAESNAALNEKLSSLLNTQKDEIVSLFDQRDKLIKALEHQQEIIKALDQSLQEQVKENNDLVNKYQQTKVEYNSELLKPKTETIPSSSLLSSDFPSDLNDRLAEIAQNESLPIQTKLRYIFSTIAQYYNPLIVNLDHDMKMLSSNQNDLVQMVSEFYTSIGIVMDISNLNTNPIITKENSQIVLNTLTKIINDKMIIEQNNAELKEKLKEISLKLKLNSTSMIEKTIDNLFAEIGKLKKQIQENINDFREDKKIQKTKLKNMIIKSQQDEQLMNQMKAKISELRNQVKELTVKLQDAGYFHDQIYSELNETRQTYEAKYEERESELLEMIQQLENELNNERNMNTTLSMRRDETIINTDNELEEMKKQVEYWKKSVDLLTKSKEEKTTKMRELEEKHERNIKDLKQKHLTEAEALKEQYELLYSQIKDKNQELRTLCQTISKSLETSQAKNDMFAQQISNLQNENQQLNLLVNANQDEQLRYRQLFETKTQAQIISIKNKCQNEIADLNSEFDKERKNLYFFIATTFKMFFDPKIEINLQTCKTISKKAAIELNRLSEQEKNLRKILGLAPAESLESSVTSLKLSLCNIRQMI